MPGTIELRLAAIALHLRTPRGDPAQGVQIALTGPFPEKNLLASADQAGAVAVRAIAAGSYTVLVRPRSLGDEAACKRFADEHGRAALDAAWLTVGAITVGAGANAPFELT